jgi:hypothetical protein
MWWGEGGGVSEGELDTTVMLFAYKDIMLYLISIYHKKINSVIHPN